MASSFDANMRGALGAGKYIQSTPVLFNQQRRKLFFSAYYCSIKFHSKYIITLLHLMVWMCYFILNYFITLQVLGLKIAIVRIVVIGLLNIGVYSFCYFYLVPKLFNRRRYLELIVGGVAVVIVSNMLKLSIDSLFTPYLLATRQSLFISSSFRAVAIVPQAIIIMVSCLLSVLKISFLKENELINLKIEDAKRELELIKAKVNPHFLLNTLNNIYAINYNESPRTNEAILQLCKVLSYTIYQNKNNVIALHEELESMTSLIGLYQLKHNNQLNIQANLPADVGDSLVMIPPLVLFSLLENAFKHSNLAEHSGAYLKLGLVMQDDGLYFTMENTHSANKTPKALNYSSGLGKEAIQKLLEHRYGNKFRFETVVTDNTYTVKLSIHGV